MKFIIISDSDLTNYITNNFNHCGASDWSIACFASDNPKAQQIDGYSIIGLDSIAQFEHDAILIAIKANRTLQKLLMQLHEKNEENIYIVTLWALDKKLDFLSPNGMCGEYVHYLSSQNDKPYLVHLETHVCDHCNLNCKACNNFSPFVREPQVADIVQFENDMQVIAARFSNIGRFFLLGGEPLLEPQLCCEMIIIFRRYFPNSELRLLTNAILLPQMTQEFWECLRRNNVIIHISLYPPMKSKLPNIEELLCTNGMNYLIAHIRDGFCKHWTRFPFEDEQFNNSRCGSAGCHYLRDGIIAKCPDAVLIANMEPELVSNDNIVLSNSDNPWEIIKNLEAPIDLCKKCTYRRKEIVPWEQTGEIAEASDWLLENRLEYENRQMSEKCRQLIRENETRQTQIKKLQEDNVLLKDSLCTKTNDLQDLDERYKHTISSLSYRIGCAITFLPRKIRKNAKSILKKH